MHPDSGEIMLDGEVVHFADPGAAVRHGIGMVHQHFMLVPVFSVAENVALGFEPTRRFGLLDRRKARDEILRISHEFGLEVEPEAIVEELPVGVQQRVEILKALSRDAHLLILDEPTSVLTPQETEGLFEIMRSLAASGRSILFITHKLKEVLAIADRITVMRLGAVIGTTTPQTTTESELASMMVGRTVELVVQKEPARPGDVVLAVEDLTVVDPRGLTVVDHISFDVHAGEILAIAGVQGNGQTEIEEALCGLIEVAEGRVTLLGRDITRASPKARLRAGIAHVPEDRVRDGLVVSMTIADNLILDVFDVAPHARFGRAQPRRGEAQRGAEAGRLRHPRELHRHAREHPVGRQPAEGDRRPRALPADHAARRRPADRAGSTSDRSSTSTSGSSRSVTVARRSSSSRRSSTRCSPSATGSRSSTAAGSWKPSTRRSGARGSAF